MWTFVYLAGRIGISLFYKEQEQITTEQQENQLPFASNQPQEIERGTGDDDTLQKN